jgi:hypothetical protein
LKSRQGDGRRLAAEWEGNKARKTYLSLQVADKKLVEGLTGLVAVANILKGLGGILAGDVEHDLLTTTNWEQQNTCQ